MLDQAVRDTVQYVVENASFVILSTIDDKGFPISRAMLNLPNNSMKNIWFTTNASSRKIMHINTNRRASAYFCIPEEWNGVLLKGMISFIGDEETKKKMWQPGWEMYYPKGVEDPDYALLLLQTESGHLYNQLKKTDFIIPWG